MSDFPQGPGWWQASDDKWYAPELHPDRQAGQHQTPEQPSPDISRFEPPVADQRVGFPPSGPAVPVPPGPTGASPGPPNPTGQIPGQVPGPPIPGQTPIGPPQRYPAPVRKRSTGKVLAIVFGVLFLLFAAGCGAFVFVFRDQIADGAIDFSNGVEAGPGTTDSAGCEVIGLRFGANYEVVASLTATDATSASHYEMSIEVISADGEVLGTDVNVFRDMEPGEERTEDVFPTITATVPWDTTSCTVTGLVRVAA